MIALASLGQGEDMPTVVAAQDRRGWGIFSREVSLSDDVEPEKVRELMQEQGLSEDEVLARKPEMATEPLIEGTGEVSQ